MIYLLIYILASTFMALITSHTGNAINKNIDHHIIKWLFFPLYLLVAIYVAPEFHRTRLEMLKDCIDDLFLKD